MFIEKKDISGLFLIDNFYVRDCRGTFLKVYQNNQLPMEISNLDFREVFITSSKKNVLRGMYFQKAPYAVDKLVTVVKGRALDVIFDMRKNSPTFSKIFSIDLGDEQNFRTVFVPAGCAHGFLALEDQTEILYHTTCEFNPDSDSGFNYNSFGFNWPIKNEDLILSNKDKNLPYWNPKGNVF